MPLRPRTALTLCLTLAGAAGCASYEPDPVDPLDVLRDLDAVQVDDLDVAWVSSGSFQARDGLTRAEATAIALRASPVVATSRRDVAIRQARLLEAGLLPDPVIGWDAMNVVADFSTDGKSTANSYLAGFNLSWEVPRWGELDAREAIARAEILEALAQLRATQWRLVRSVRQTYLELLVTRSNLAQTRRLEALATRTLTFFQRARGAGAATALHENLARVSLGGLEAQAIELEGRALLGRQALNALLGLPPQRDWKLQAALPARGRAPREDPQQLVRVALERRPDVQVALAQYAQSEARLQLEVSLQMPKISVGTGLGIQLPFFSRFNQFAIATATRAREAARLRVREVVHAVRAEVHAAVVERDQAHRLLTLYEAKLEPQTRRTVELTRAAFKAREVTLVEILTAQAQALQAQARYQAARGRWAAALLGLSFATGRLPLPPADPPNKETR